MAESGVINQDEPQPQQSPAGRAPDRTQQIQGLRLEKILRERALDAELPRKRVGLTPVARDKYGVPVVMSKLPEKKAAPRKRKTQRQTKSPQSVAPTPSPAPAPVAAPSSMGPQQPNKENTDTGSDRVSNKDKGKGKAIATTDVRTAVQAQRPDKAQGGSGKQQGKRIEQPGKLTLISAEQLEDLRADLIQSAKDNGDLRHEVAVLERKLAQTEEERHTYWECGLEWARREKGLYMELEYWKAQARAAMGNNVGDDGSVGPHGFVGGHNFGAGAQDAQHHQGHAPALGQGLELGPDAEYAAGPGAVHADFGGGFGTDYNPAGLGAGLDHPVAVARELEKERDVMLRMD